MTPDFRVTLGAVLAGSIALAACGSADSSEAGNSAAATTTARSAPRSCESAVSPELVSQTCGHPFMLAKDGMESSDRKCSVELLSAEFGTKYGAKGISPTVSYKRTYHPRGSNGRNMAQFTYETALEREKGRDNFKTEVPDLGQAAFYAKVSIGRNVYWYDGDYFHMLSADDGHDIDSDFRPYCPPENLPGLARAIHGQGG